MRLSSQWCLTSSLAFGKELVVDCLGPLGSAEEFKHADKHGDRRFNPWLPWHYCHGWRIRQSLDATSRLGCPWVSPTQKPCQSPAYQVSYKKLMDAAWDVIEKSDKMQKWNRKLGLSLLTPWLGPALNANGRNSNEDNRAIIRSTNLESWTEEK